MAPITDDAVDNLKDLVSKLESRVEQLETRLQKMDGSTPKATKSNKELRMVLMGPPGAGIVDSTAEYEDLADT